MTVTDLETCPVLGIGGDWPDELWLLEFDRGRKYGCFCSGDIHGLACFRDETAVFACGEWLPFTSFAAISVSLDEARRIAVARPHPVTAMHLMSGPRKVEATIYVR